MRNYLQSLKQTSLVAHVETEQTVEGENGEKLQSTTELYLTATVTEQDPTAYSDSLSSSQTQGGFVDENEQNNSDKVNEEPTQQTDQELESIQFAKDELFKNFFSMLIKKFSDFKVYENNEIACEEFLRFCSDLFFLIDKFGSSAFIPVKIDVYGNIDKIRQRYVKDPEKYYCVQAIIQQEIDGNTIAVKNSATLSLLWLNRAIAFLREFLAEFIKTEKPDVSLCVHASYTKTLKPHHNWVVRSIFSLAVRSVPNTDTFMKGLAENEEALSKENRETFEIEVKKSMNELVGKLDVLIGIIKDFYDENDLERQLQ